MADAGKWEPFGASSGAPLARMAAVGSGPPVPGQLAPASFVFGRFLDPGRKHGGGPGGRRTPRPTAILVAKTISTLRRIAVGRSFCVGPLRWCSRGTVSPLTTKPEGENGMSPVRTGEPGPRRRFRSASWAAGTMSMRGNCQTLRRKRGRSLAKKEGETGSRSWAEFGAG